MQFHGHWNDDKERKGMHMSKIGSKIYKVALLTLVMGSASFSSNIFAIEKIAVVGQMPDEGPKPGAEMTPGQWGMKQQRLNSFYSSAPSGGRKSSPEKEEKKEEETKEQCVLTAKKETNVCLAVVTAGAAVGGYASTACGVLIPACLAIVGLEVTAATLICQNAGLDAEFACSN